ncbi:hypothetical protein C7B09_25315 [Escherichia albertii]|uniref:Transposase n=1 Tax=Escherichia albertii TaxID=208962 RepID=A0ABX5HAN5_ESCAL|nr:hypothetical protein C7B09_25315 [Escherichia albertii]
MELHTANKNETLITAGIEIQALNIAIECMLLKWHTEFGHLNRGDMLTSEQHRCSNEKKKF